MLSAGSTVNQLCRPPKNIFCMTQTCPGKAIFSENQQLLLIETVDLQERVTPLLTGSRDAPDNKSGSLSAGGGEAGGEKRITHLTATVTSLQTLCSCTHPYLPCLHLASLSMLSFSSISHCNRSWQRKRCFRTLLAGTQLLSADNGEQEEKRRWRRRYATEAELTWILGIWVSIQK